MKELFPVYSKNKDLIYLDSAASSLKPKAVIDAINDYYKSVTDRFKKLITTPPDETSDSGKKNVSVFKAAENINLTITATLKGNDSRCAMTVEDKTKK